MAEDFLLDRRLHRLKQENGGRSWMREYLAQGTYDFVEFYDEFHGGDISMSGYATVTGTDGSHDKVAGALNGESTLDVGDGATSGDNEYGAINLGLEWAGDNYATMAVRLKLNNAATVKVECGFTDALADAGAVNDLGGETATADDAALWVMDTDDNGLWQAFGVKDAGTPAKVEGTNTINTVGTSYVTLVTALRKDAARFQILNAAEQLAYDSEWQADMIQGGSLVTPWIFVQNRTGTIDRFVTIDYIRVWQLRQAQ